MSSGGYVPTISNPGSEQPRSGSRDSSSPRGASSSSCGSAGRPALAERRHWSNGRPLQQLVAAEPLSAEEAAQRFTKAKPEIVARHLEYLAPMGALQRSEDGRYHEVLQPA